MRVKSSKNPVGLLHDSPWNQPVVDMQPGPGGADLEQPCAGLHAARLAQLSEGSPDETKCNPGIAA